MVGAPLSRRQSLRNRVAVVRVFTVQVETEVSNIQCYLRCTIMGLRASVRQHVTPKIEIWFGCNVSDYRIQVLFAVTTFHNCFSKSCCSFWAPARSSSNFLSGFLAYSSLIRFVQNQIQLKHMHKRTQTNTNEKVLQ